MSKMMYQSFLKQREHFNQMTSEKYISYPIPENVQIFRNVPYMTDRNPAHRMDIYRPANEKDFLPVIINVHGGGLMMGNKEFNFGFCVDLCQQGFLVFSIEYQLVPDVLVYDQYADVIHAMTSIGNVLPLYGGDKDHIYMVGDSAGAYLIVYAMAMQRSPLLAEAAHTIPSILPIRALGLISGMFYTCRFDKIGLFMPKTLYGASYKNGPFAPYTNPENPEIAGNLPPCYLVTSHNDFLHRYTLDFSKTLHRYGIPYKLDDYPPNKRLAHAFSVFNPEFPESQEVIQHLAQYLKSI